MGDTAALSELALGATVAADLKAAPVKERPVIGRTVTVETQRHSPVAKEEAPAKDASPVVATAKADTKKSKYYKPKVFARQPNNYGYGNALGYAEESGYTAGSRISGKRDLSDCRSGRVKRYN